MIRMEKTHNKLERNNVNTGYVGTENGKHTNYHYILWYDVDRTILVRHETFENISLDRVQRQNGFILVPSENSLDFPRWSCWFSRKKSRNKTSLPTRYFPDENWNSSSQRIYKNTEIFFCNVEEAQRILEEESRDLPTLLRKMSSFGPKIVVITDGINGAYSFDTRTGEMWFVRFSHTHP